MQYDVIHTPFDNNKGKAFNPWSTPPHDTFHIQPWERATARDVFRRSSLDIVLYLVVSPPFLYPLLQSTSEVESPAHASPCYHYWWSRGLRSFGCTCTHPPPPSCLNHLYVARIACQCPSPTATTGLRWFGCSCHFWVGVRVER